MSKLFRFITVLSLVLLQGLAPVFAALDVSEPSDFQLSAPAEEIKVPQLNLNMDTGTGTGTQTVELKGDVDVPTADPLSQPQPIGDPILVPITGDDSGASTIEVTPISGPPANIEVKGEKEEEPNAEAAAPILEKPKLEVPVRPLTPSMLNPASPDMYKKPQIDFYQQPLADTFPYYRIPNYKMAPDLLEPKYTKPTYNGVELKIENPFVDVGHSPDGEKFYRFFSAPRAIRKFGEEKREMPEGWNIFSELDGMKLKSTQNNGYSFTAPMQTDGGVVVKPGIFEMGIKKYEPQRAKFTEYKDVDSTHVTLYEEMYPGIDLKFIDMRLWRERQIVIKKMPEGINQSDILTFWEHYDLPTGSKLVTTDKNPVAQGETIMKQQTLVVLGSNGSLFSIGAASVFDATNSDESLEELTQVVVLDTNKNSLRIGVQLPAQYLLDPTRTFPVTVDPIYYACDAGDLGGLVCSLNNSMNPDLTDLYLRYLSDRNQDLTELYLGYYAAPDGPAPRMIVAQFNLDNAPAINPDRIIDANLYLRYTQLGSGPFRGVVGTRARKITQNWAPGTITYSAIRGTLQDVSGIVNLNTNMAAGTDIIYPITSAFTDWVRNPGANYGILVEPTPAWPAGTSCPNWRNPANGQVWQCPPWSNVQFRFQSSRHPSGYGPYLVVRVQGALEPNNDAAHATAIGALANYSQNNLALDDINDTDWFSFVYNNRTYYFKVRGYDGAVGDYALQFTRNNNAVRIETLPANGSNVDTVVTLYDTDGSTQLAEDDDSGQSNFSLLQHNLPLPPADPLEPNNNSGQAFNIGVNANYANNQLILTQDDQDWFRFTYNNQTYYFKVRGFNGNSIGDYNLVFSRNNNVVTLTTQQRTGLVDTYLELYNTNAVDILAQDDDSGADNFSTLTYTFPLPGDPLEPNNNSGQATNIGNTNPYSNNQLTITAGDQDWFRFNYNNQTYYFKVRGYNADTFGDYNLSFSRVDRALTIETSSRTGNVDTYLELYNQNDLNNFIAYDDDSGAGPFSLLVYQFGYCGGSCGGGGGGNPPPSGQLPDQDRDSFADVEEKFAGTNIGGAQTVSLYDTNGSRYLSSHVDAKSDSYGGDPVNTRTGVFELTQEDISLRGRGVPIDIIRSYNSRVIDKNNRLGNGWNLSMHMYYYQNPQNNNVHIYLGGTLAGIFTTSDGGVTFTSPPGVEDTLYQENSYLVYRTLNGVKYIFSREWTSQLGMIARIEDTNGNITQFDYVVSQEVPLLSSITDPSGRRVDFTYDLSDQLNWDKIRSIRENAGNPARVITYGYDANSNLTSVTTNRDYSGVNEQITRTYTYVNNRLSTYTDPRGTTLYNDYDGNGRVTQQREFNPRIDQPGQSRRTYEFQYLDGPDPAVANSASCTIVKNFRDANNSYDTRTCFDSRGLVLYKRDGVGGVTTFEYNNEGMPTRVTNPGGNLTINNYDGRRRLTDVTLPDTTSWQTQVLYTYENTFNKMTEKSEVVRPVGGGAETRRTTFYDINPANGNTRRIDYYAGARAGDPVYQEFFTYDQFGNVASHTDKTGARVDYTYNAPSSNYKIREETTAINAAGQNELIANQYTYDAYGNMLTHTTPRGNVFTYQYDNHNNLRRKVDPEANVWTYAYDPENHKISETDPLNRVTSYVYDTDVADSLRSVSRTGPGGETITTSYEYDYVGNMTREINGRNNSVSYEYDSANRLRRTIGAFNTVTVTYDPNSNKQSETNTLGQRTEYEYDQRNSRTVIRKFDDDNTPIVTRTVYDGFGRAVSSTDPEGRITIGAYDFLDRRLSTTDAEGNVTTYAYDGNGRKIGQTNPRAQNNAQLRNNDGYSESYSYDRAGRLIRTQNATNKVTLVFYDLDGNMIRSVDRQNSDGTMNSHSATFVYDRLGRKQSQTDAYNNTTSYEYDLVNNLKKVTDPLLRETRYDYDDFNRLITQTDQGGNVTSYVYDANNNKSSLTVPGGQVTTYTYDTADRLTKIVADQNNPLQAIEFRYDASNNKIRETNRRGIGVDFTYDSLNRLKIEANVLGSTTTYTYNRVGSRLTESIGNRITTFEYDSLNRISRVVHPGGKSESTTYDPDGNVATKTDGKDQITRFTYDALNRRIQKQLSDQSTVTYGYDNWNNVTSTTDVNGATTFVYDTMNRVTTENRSLTDIPGSSFIVRRTYNADNSLASLEDAAHRVVNYAYNNRGLLENVSLAQRSLARYVYNGYGKPTQLTHGNGLVTNYGYDALNRPNRLAVQNAQGGVLYSHDYTYDANNNRTQIAEIANINGQATNRTIGYTYDQIDQLTDVDYSNVPGNSDLHFEYDSVGNRRSSSSAVGAISYANNPNSYELDSYTTNGRTSVTMGYDGNGSLISERFTRLGKAVKSVDYVWDAQDRLSQIQYNDTSLPAFMPAMPLNTLSFAYDDAGNRVKKAVSNGDTTYYINNGLSVLDELDSQGVVEKTIVSGLAQVAEIDRQGRITFTHSDILGSALLISDEAGAIVQQYEYDPFGAIISSLGNSDGSGESRYLFTGQEYDAESNLYYYNSRYYNPIIGRFISRDIYMGRDGDTVSRNTYVYVKNNPIKYTDPTGNSFFGDVSDFFSGVGSGIADAAVAVKDFAVDTAVAVKDVAVATAVAVKTTVVNTAVSVKKAVDNVNWSMVGSGVVDTVVGGIETIIGGVTAAGGFTLATGGTAATAGLGAVATVGGGVALMGIGANSVVSGGTKTVSGVGTIWNGLMGKEEEVDVHWNPIRDSVIDNVTEKGSLTNSLLQAAYTGVEIFSAGKAVTALLSNVSGTKKLYDSSSTIIKATGGTKPDLSIISKVKNWRAHLGYHPIGSQPAFWHIGVGTAGSTWAHPSALSVLTGIAGLGSALTFADRYNGSVSTNNDKLIPNKLIDKK